MQTATAGSASGTPKKQERSVFSIAYIGFRILARPLLDQIKKRHGQDKLLHVFPAAPISICVEFGRIRAAKADLPWQVYDQVNALGGFVPAIRIPPGEQR